MADLTRALDAYRAMEPVAEVLRALESGAGPSDWLSLELQVRTWSAEPLQAQKSIDRN